MTESQPFQSLYSGKGRRDNKHRCNTAKYRLQPSKNLPVQSQQWKY